MVIGPGMCTCCSPSPPSPLYRRSLGKKINNTGLHHGSSPCACGPMPGVRYDIKKRHDELIQSQEFDAWRVAHLGADT
jgi:hypothetical protein